VKRTDGKQTLAYTDLRRILTNKGGKISKISHYWAKEGHPCFGAGFNMVVVKNYSNFELSNCATWAAGERMRGITVTTLMDLCLQWGHRQGSKPVSRI